MEERQIRLIFDQLLSIVQHDRKLCIRFNKCDFSYKLHHECNHLLLEVVYHGKDECCRPRRVYATVDVTGICLSDITTKKWDEYITGIACKFVHDICPPKLVISKIEKTQCKKKVECWQPGPCTKTTTIIKMRPKPKHVEEPEIIYEKECDCIKKCVRKPCVNKERIIMRTMEPKEKHCGCGSDDEHEHEHEHDHKHKNDHQDEYDTHYFRPQMSSKPCECGCN